MAAASSVARGLPQKAQYARRMPPLPVRRTQRALRRRAAPPARQNAGARRGGRCRIAHAAALRADWTGEVGPSGDEAIRQGKGGMDGRLVKDGRPRSERGLYTICRIVLARGTAVPWRLRAALRPAPAGVGGLPSICSRCAPMGTEAPSPAGPAGPGRARGESRGF